MYSILGNCALMTTAMIFLQKRIVIEVKVTLDRQREINPKTCNTGDRFK